MTLTRTFTGVASATTCDTRECIAAGVAPGLQILCSGVFTTRVAECFRAAITARKSGCDDGAGAREPGTAGAESGVDVARAVAAGRRQ